jgi:predicted DNA-binding transcriptional regulator AlpA
MVAANHDCQSERLLTRKEAAAQIFGYSEKTLYRLSQPLGPIPVVRTPGSRLVRYSPAALREFIRQSSAGTSPSSGR